MGSSSSTHISLLGLDGSGKTTLLYRLKLGHYISTAPTVSFNCEKIRTPAGNFEVWDVGGDEKLRPLWRSYTRRAAAVVFVVDSAATDRIPEVKQELLKTAKLPECNGIPFLILANKQDLPGAVEPETISRQLGLSEVRHETLTVGTCAVTGEGLTTALHQLRDLIRGRKNSRR